MASIVNYVADGATNQFQIPFTYINQTDVVVTVNGTTPTFTFVNSTTINIASTPTSGAKVIIKRVTPLNALVDFTDGSTLFEADLDLAHQQNRLIAEESRDRADSAIATINANITNIDTVAGIEANVTTVAGNTTNINSVATNMAEVLTADTNAATATTKAGEASASASTASAQATISTTKAGESSTSAAEALASKNAASASESASSTSETNSANSATSSANSASASGSSASSASSSQTVATTKAAEAVVSANNSAVSATNSANSSTTATTKANEASASQSAAATSEANALSSKNAAASSVINAATSETNSASSATASANSAATANTKANEAAASATSSANSATASANSATAAAASAASITGAETNAANSAISAASSATAASASKDAALAALDSFDDRYLGVKSSNPSVDNDGNALVAGSLYFNSTDDTMKVYEGSAWVAAYASLSGAVLQANNLSDLTSASDARANLGLGTAATTAATAYATAAQGTLATNALPKAGGTLTGNLNVGGTVTVGDGHTIGNDASDNLKIVSSSGENLIMSTGDDFFVHAGSDTRRLKIDNSGDISFYEDTGTTAKFFWDASAESLGIGTDSPSDILQVNHPSTAKASSIRANATNGDAYFAVGNSDLTDFILLYGGHSGNNASTVGWDDSNDLRFATYQNHTGTFGSERMRIDSSGNVGINTSSPSSNLHIKTSVDNSLTQGLIIERSANSDKGYINYQAGAFQIRATDGDPIAFGQVSNERMRIDSSGRLLVGLTGASGFGTVETDSLTTTGQCIFARTGGNVGIGTTSPPSKLSIEGDGIAFRIDGTANTSRGILFRSVGGSAEGFIQTDGSMHFLQEDAGKYIKFSTANTEAMRIDSSGNLLVGKTSGPNYNAVGIDLASTGNIQATRSGGEALVLNRQTNDGDIAHFRQDGTLVGSIGVSGGDLNIGTGDTGIGFADSLDAILPMTSTGNTVRSNAIDIGTSSYKFKDGYFSGNLYGDGSNLTGVGGSTTVGAVGTYVLAWTYLYANRAIGTTIAGSQLRAGGLAWRTNAGNTTINGDMGVNTHMGSGTYQFMSSVNNMTGSSYYTGGLWVRIS